MLRSSFDFVIVDTPPGFTPEVIASIDSSTHVCMVGMLDSLSLKNTKLGLETLELMGYDRERIRLVLNRADRASASRRMTCGRSSAASPTSSCPATVTSRAPSTRASRWSLLKPRSDVAAAFRALARCTRRPPTAASAKRSPPAAQEEGLMDLQERLASRPAGRAAGRADPFAEIKNRIHLAVIGELGPQLFNVHMDPIALRERVFADIRGHLDAETGISRDDRERLANEIADDILGHGPLERLLADETVTEIMVNGPYDIWVERQGRLYETTVRFNDDSHLRRIINKMVAQVGRRIDESSPMVDARLPDGSRVNAVIPPLSLSGPLVTIRKFSKQRLEMSDMIRLGTLTTRDGRVPPALRAGRAEHPRLGRHRLRQDDAPERALDGDPGRRAHRHDRGRRRAAAQPAARAAAGGAAEEHRGRGRDRRSASWCATRCACGPTGSSSARCAAPRRSTCCRR